jgi:hypothetical protein
VTLNSRLAEIDPSVWDNYTLDEMSRGIGDAMGVPQAWKRPDSAVRQIREARERLLAQQRALEQTKLAGDAARGLGKGVEENSPLARMAPAA